MLDTLSWVGKNDLAFKLQAGESDMLEFERLEAAWDQRDICFNESHYRVW